MIDEQRRKNSSCRGATRETEPDPIISRGNEALLTADQFARFILGVVFLNGFTGQT
jgi:hypothetical protein